MTFGPFTDRVIFFQEIIRHRMTILIIRSSHALVFLGWLLLLNTPIFTQILIYWRFDEQLSFTRFTHKYTSCSENPTLYQITIFPLSATVNRGFLHIIIIKQEKQMAINETSTLIYSSRIRLMQSTHKMIMTHLSLF